MSEIKDSLGLENVGIVRRNCDIDTLIKFAVEKINFRNAKRSKIESNNFQFCSCSLI